MRIRETLVSRRHTNRQTHQTKRPQRFNSRSLGHSLIELATVCILLSIFALLCADVGIIMLADGTNERACRDAARAAAGAQDQATSLTLAQAACATHHLSTPFASSPVVDTTSFVYNDFNGSPPPDTSPYVEVVTQMTVNLPAPILFGGAKFTLQNGRMVLRKLYHFPIVKEKLYLQ